jgi:hypothetical protein
MPRADGAILDVGISQIIKHGPEVRENLSHYPSHIWNPIVLEL